MHLQSSVGIAGFPVLWHSRCKIVMQPLATRSIGMHQPKKTKLNQHWNLTLKRKVQINESERRGEDHELGVNVQETFHDGLSRRFCSDWNSLRKTVIWTKPLYMLPLLGSKVEWLTPHPLPIYRQRHLYVQFKEADVYGVIPRAAAIGMRTADRGASSTSALDVIISLVWRAPIWSCPDWEQTWLLHSSEREAAPSQFSSPFAGVCMHFSPPLERHSAASLPKVAEQPL